MAASTSMPPTPESRFAFDAQAWTTMASQLSCMAAQQQGKGVDTEGAPEGNRADRPPLPRTKSSPSLAVRRRRRASFDDDVEGGTPPPSRESCRSKSFIAPSGRGISGLAGKKSLHSSFSSASSEELELKSERCEVHPQVWLRSGRCPRCAAGERIRHKSFRKNAKMVAANTTAAVAGSKSDVGITVIGVWENGAKEKKIENPEMPSCSEKKMGEDGHNGVTNENYSNRAETAIDQANEEKTEGDWVEDEVEEVSLDEKWADALRFISQRLADQKAQEDPEAGVTRAPPPIALDHGLQETIERATQSILAEDVEGVYEMGEASVCDDDTFESSTARGAPVAGAFAETKGGRRPPLSSHSVDRHPAADALSRGLEQFASAAGFLGAEVVAGGAGACPSTGSDSSVTLSVGSSGERTERIEGIRNSLLGPPPLTPSPTSGSDVSGEVDGSLGSPKCVIRKNALDGDRSGVKADCCHRLENNNEEEETEEEEQDFDNSFFAVEPKVYSEEKLAPPPKSITSNRGTVHNQPAGTLKPQHCGTVLPECLLQGDLQTDCTGVEDPPAMEDQYYPQKVLKGVQSTQVQGEDVASDESSDDHEISASSNCVSSAPDKAVESSSAVSSNKSPPTNKGSPAPSFFSALVHNSRARSKSRPRSKSQSRPRSKSRGRDATTAVASNGVDGQWKKGKSKARKEPARTAENRDEKRREHPKMNGTEEDHDDSLTVVPQEVPRARSKSRPRSKSQSRPRSKSRGRGATTAVASNGVDGQWKTGKSKARKEPARTAENKDEKRREHPKMNGTEEDHDDSATVVPQEAPLQGKTPQPQRQRIQQKEAAFRKRSEEYPQHTTTPSDTKKRADWSRTGHPIFLRQDRGPITHPHYKLGDLAREEDMVVFPRKSKSSRCLRARSRRRRRRRKRDDYSSSGDSSSCSDGDDGKSLQRREVNIVLATIGHLRHLDAAFVRRSDGQWTYALVADGDATQIRFVVNDRGSTKSFPKSLWKSCVRRIRVLTPRQGDRFAVSGKPSRKRRSIGRSRSSHRGGGRGKGRLVSPSPTRRNSGVLNLPPTIFESYENE